jgi:hypothetical protein
MIFLTIKIHAKPISLADILETKKALPMAEPLFKLTLTASCQLKIKQQQP